MAKEIILSKESSESEVKAYFNAVLKLSQSDNEFPINIDEVWPLVYSRRQEAVRALTSSEQFIENVDYQTVRKDAQQDLDNGWGGTNKVDYHLTVSCMEFFIARKVRPVFEVYRQVFHKSIQHSVEFPCPDFGNPADIARAWAFQYERNQALRIENETIQNKLSVLQPLANFASYFLDSSDNVSFSDFANILNQNGLYNKGRNALLKWFRCNGYLLKHGLRYNMPSQKSISNRWMKVVIESTSSTGYNVYHSRAVLTPVGVKYFIGLFRKLKSDKSTLTIW